MRKSAQSHSYRFVPERFTVSMTYLSTDLKSMLDDFLSFVRPGIG